MYNYKLGRIAQLVRAYLLHTFIIIVSESVSPKLPNFLAEINIEVSHDGSVAPH